MPRDDPNRFSSEQSQSKTAVTWRRRIASFFTLATLFAMLWRTSRWLTTVSIMLRLARVPLPLIALWIPKLILDAMIAHMSHQMSSSTKIWLLVAAELATAIANDVLGRACLLCDTLLADRFAKNVSIAVILHASTLDLAYFENSYFYDILERSRNQKNRMMLIPAVMNMLQDFLSLVALSVGLAVFSPWLIALLSLALVGAIWGESRFTLLKYSVSHTSTPSRRMLDYLRIVGSSVECAKEVKVFGLGQHLASKYSSIADDLHEQYAGLAKRRSVVTSALNLLSNLGYYGAYVLILIRTLGSQISIGMFVFLTGSFVRSRSYIDRITANIVEVSECAMYLKDVITLFETKPTIFSPPGAKKVRRPPLLGFEFRNVSFSYPGTRTPALEKISFSLRPGESVALVGENASGKTTLIKLLLRLYDPTEGQILLDGVDLREYDLKDLHSAIGIIFQDFLRYDMSVRENIGFGSVDDLHDDGRIIAAVEKAGSGQLIARLPKGYDQIIGHKFEGGIGLSGGEWQKLALARACMRNAELIILDEPTASLDAVAEYELFSHFANISRERMLVLISHKLSTVRMASQILVLKHGRIIERGRHDELVRLGNRYAQLFDLQASAYR